jgi:hypothetical protein
MHLLLELVAVVWQFGNLNHGRYGSQCTPDVVSKEFSGLEPPDVVVGVHALRSGKLFLSMPPSVPKLLLLSGTDVSQCMDLARPQGPESHVLLGNVLAACRVIVAFRDSMKAALLEYCHTVHPSLCVPPCVVIPQAVSLRAASDKAVTDTSGVGDLFSFLGIPTTARIYLQPCGIRPVKDPTYLVKVCVPTAAP